MNFWRAKRAVQFSVCFRVYFLESCRTLRCACSAGMRVTTLNSCIQTTKIIILLTRNNKICAELNIFP